MWTLILFFTFTVGTGIGSGQVGTTTGSGKIEIHGFATAFDCEAAATHTGGEISGLKITTTGHQCVQMP